MAKITKQSPSIYVSIAMSSPWALFLDIKDRILGSNNIECTAWDRNFQTYSPHDINVSEAVVFVIPNNGWRTNIGDLPSGMRKDISRAIDGNKDLYIYYRPQNGLGEGQIYRANYDGEDLIGISHSYLDIIEKYKSTSYDWSAMSECADIHEKQTGEKSAATQYFEGLKGPNPCGEVAFIDHYELDPVTGYRKSGDRRLLLL